MLQPGDPTPTFELEASTGGRVKSDSLAGSRWVIFFYPKDSTSGCAIETSAFGRLRPQFAQLQVTVLGCSSGDIAAKRQFAAECSAPELPLLADQEGELAKAFGCRNQTGGIARTTFAVAADGTVQQVWQSVKPEGHAEAVLSWVRDQER